MKLYRISFKKWPAVLVPFFILTGCKKLVDIDPPTLSITAEDVYKSDASAIGVLNGIYINISNSEFYKPQGISSLSLYAGLSADELTLWSGVTAQAFTAYYSNSLITSDMFNYGTEYWSTCYASILSCNQAIENLGNSTELTPGVRSQLLGEAKFVRALNLFYLVTLYGDVPLPLTSDYKANATLHRTAQTLVLTQIITDLKDAQSTLNEYYVTNDAITAYSINAAERVRPNKYAASALLARAYLYAGEYANAEAAATTVINNTSYYKLQPLNQVFIKNSMEAIWQLQPVTTNFITNTQDGFYFNIPSSGPSDVNFSTGGHPVYLSPQLLNAFEKGDQRRNIGNWVDSVKVGTDIYYFPSKYKANTATSLAEYLMVLRLGEQYLIRAEAKAQQDKITGSGGAISDLDSIRLRAGLTLYSGPTDRPSVLTAILHERQVELFTEWGHRWLDLKRTLKVNEVMSVVTPLKGGVWKSTKQLYPIPVSDILKDPNITPNPGY